MALVDSIDSNITGLSIAEEQSFGVLPGTPIWIPYEPNSYGPFGRSTVLTPRNPINPDRQRKKGVITDASQSANFLTDLTQTNLQSLLQGFWLADFRPKGEEAVTSVTGGGTTNDYNVAATAGFQIGDIILASGFTNTENNGIKNVDAVTVDTLVSVSETLVNEGSPPSDAKLVVVGHTAGTADIDVDATGTFPAYTSTTLDFTTLGLNVGEFIFVGGDTANSDFVNTENNGFKRVRTIAANRLELDKSEEAMITETGTGLAIEFYLGRVLKNELSGSIVKRTYQLERTLGAPDDALPAQIQSEYVTKAFPNELAFNIPNSDKLTVDLTWLAGGYEVRTGATGVKSGTRPTLVDTDAFSTASDFARMRLATHTDGVEAPTELAAFIEELTVNLSNNASENKAVTVLGSFAIPAGTFAISGTLTGYFYSVDAITAVQTNQNVTFDMQLAKANAGIALDLPLIGLGDGILGVEQDQSIRIPLTMDAATAKLIDPNLDHTAMLVFFDYLPTVAE